MMMTVKIVMMMMMMTATLMMMTIYQQHNQTAITTQTSMKTRMRMMKKMNCLMMNKLRKIILRMSQPLKLQTCQRN